jgi:single-stranded-DNA-specific exonuclease
MDGVDLEKVLTRCASHLEEYGGHATAAGFSIRKENIPAFRKDFEAACRDVLDEQALIEKYDVDAWIHLSEADDLLYDALHALQPMGLGNQTPLWGVRNVRTQGPVRIVGANHLKLTIVSGGTERDAIGYGLGDRVLPEGPLDILFQMQRNRFKGRETLQLSIKDFRPATT